MHCFHFSCVRPLLSVTVRRPTNSKPVQEEADGFLCPLCRMYVDLTAEPEEDDAKETDIENVAGEIERVQLLPEDK